MPTFDLFELDRALNGLVARVTIERPRLKPLDWTADELAYLREHYADMMDFEIAEVLGRSENAVKVYRTRQCLPAASRAQIDLVTSNVASQVLGVWVHAMTWWCDHGLIPFVMGGPNRQVRMIRRRDLTAWAVNPLNWVYFDWRKITDPHLRRLCELRAARWGDEWWTTRQVADYHGVDVKDVTRLITLTKRIKACCPPISRGGRHATRRWAYWYVLKSEATRPDLVFYRAKGVPGEPRKANFTPRADAWIMRARELYGWSWNRIARSMGGKRRKAPNGWTIKMRYDHLNVLDQIENLIP
jgi:hypothetical protein